MECNKYKNRKTKTRWHLDEWGDLNALQLRQKLLERMANSVDVQKRFWEKVDRRSDAECWNWFGALGADGYGILISTIGKYGNRRMGFRVPRISFLLHYKKLPDDMFVCHHCDNPKCVNPHHLFLGKQKQNVEDRDRKNRQAFGSRHGRSKISEEDVKQARFLRFTKKWTYKLIAEKFRMGTSSIREAIVGSHWGHV